jgi:hypothetical protein
MKKNSRKQLDILKIKPGFDTDLHPVDDLGPC